MPLKGIPLAERLAIKLAPPNENGCREWQGFRNWFGYGLIRNGRKRERTHRVAWEILNGPIPDGLHVLHKCDNPPCCEISHLFLGTDKDNHWDAINKNRHVHKLTEEQVKEIIKSPLSAKELAERFGVTPPMIYFIRKGLFWKRIYDATEKPIN